MDKFFWMRCLWFDKNWSKAEEREDEKGNDDEGQLKACEWQVHLHQSKSHSSYFPIWNQNKMCLFVFPYRRS